LEAHLKKGKNMEQKTHTLENKHPNFKLIDTSNNGPSTPLDCLRLIVELKQIKKKIVEDAWDNPKQMNSVFLIDIRNEITNLEQLYCLYREIREKRQEKENK
jgi:hypothetical protein